MPYKIKKVKVMILKTIELKGLYGSAKIFTDNVEEGAKSQVQDQLEQE